MAPIATFDFQWLLGEDEIREIQVALGCTGPNDWVLIRTSPPKDEYEPLEWCRISVQAEEEPFPSPTPFGHPIIALKSYSENAGLLSRLQGAGIVQPTGRRLKQGFVYLEMVEILVPKEQWIKCCGGCGKWEKLDHERFKWCVKCKNAFYCSPDCHKKDWRARHKTLCGKAESEEQLAWQQAKAQEKTIDEMKSAMEDMGVKIMMNN